MTEAMDWSVFRWLFEKSRVRETADQANAALSAAERAVKARWSAEVKAAYKLLTAKSAKSSRKPAEDPETELALDPAMSDLLAKVVAADEAAEKAHLDAENTFDEAEQQLNTDLAKDGCKKAVHSWFLHGKAIHCAEAVLDALLAPSTPPRKKQ